MPMANDEGTTVMIESTMLWNEKRIKASENNTPARFLRRQWKHNKPVRSSTLLGRCSSFTGAASPKVHFDAHTFTSSHVTPALHMSTVRIYQHPDSDVSVVLLDVERCGNSVRQVDAKGETGKRTNARARFG